MTEGIDERTDPGRARVLIAEDEADLRELYADYLADEFDVVTATDGEGALAVLDESIDVVLLDRRMPGLHGDDTLESIRESGVDVRIAALTGVDADLDVVGLPVDAYLEKPVEAAALRETVDRLVRVARYDDRVRRYYAATQKRAVLEDAPHVSEADAAYQELLRRCRTLERGIDDLRDSLDDTDYALLFRGLGDVPDDSDDSASDLFA